MTTPKFSADIADQKHIHHLEAGSPGLGYVVNNHGDRKSLIPWVVGPLSIHGLIFEAYTCG